MHCPLRPSFWSRVYGLQGDFAGETCGPDLLFFLSWDRRCFESGMSQPLGHGVQPSLVTQDLWSVYFVAFNITGTLELTTRCWGLPDSPPVAEPQTSAVCPQLPCFRGPTPTLCAPPGLRHTSGHQGSSSSGSPPPGSSRVPCVNAENPRPAAPPGTARLARMTGDGPFAHGQQPSRVSRVSGVRCSRYPVCGLVWERGSQAGASRWGRMGRPPGEGPGHPQPFTLSPGPRRLDWRAGLSVDTVRVMRARVQRSERGLGAKWPQRPPHLPGQASGCPAQLPVTRPSLAVFPLPSQGWARAVSPPRCV